MNRDSFHSIGLRAVLAAAFGVVCSLSPRAVHASESFPGAILEHLTKTGAAPVCAPACTLCHTSPSGGVETVRDDGFTANLRGQSAYAWNVVRMRMPPSQLLAGDPSTVGPALDALEKLPCQETDPPSATACDSDKDGAPDVAELRLGLNPDGPGELGECPQYGCGASIAPVAARPAELSGAWLAAALAALVVARRRR
jgi:MYXO-CTERM domain-containing protein